MIETQLLSDSQSSRSARDKNSSLSSTVKKVFGSTSDPMPKVEQRAREAFSDQRMIVWEGNAETFQFSFVGGDAEAILGYPKERWIKEPTFWADTVVHPDDRDEAVAFCAVATGNCQDHDFVYRAMRADGTIVKLHDIVQVARGVKGVPERLRGIMLEVEDDELQS